VLRRKPRTTHSCTAIFDGEKEAKLIALAAPKPPKGRARWTVAIVGNKGRGTRASSSARATQRSETRAQKNILKPHRRQCWVIPPKANSAFVAAMEDVLAVYMRPHDPIGCMVCLDETSKQLIAETRVPIAMKPGRAARVDYEYERNGTANLFMLFAPLEAGAMSSDRRPHRHRLCSRLEGVGRYPLRACQDHRADQTIYNIHAGVIYGPSRPPKPGAGPSVSSGIHAQARQLAQPGRIQLGDLSTQCHRPAAFPTSKISSTKSRLGAHAHMPTHQGPTGNDHNQNCPQSNQAPITVNLAESGD